MTTDVAGMTGKDRRRAFEDAVLPNAPRPYGEIETGIGSPFSSLPEADQQHHAALCSLVVAEQLRDRAAAEHARLADAYARALAKVGATARHISHVQTIITQEELA